MYPVVNSCQMELADVNFYFVGEHVFWSNRKFYYCAAWKQGEAYVYGFAEICAHCIRGFAPKGLRTWSILLIVYRPIWWCYQVKRTTFFIKLWKVHWLSCSKEWGTYVLPSSPFCSFNLERVRISSLTSCLFLLWNLLIMNIACLMLPHCSRWISSTNQLSISKNLPQLGRFM